MMISGIEYNSLCKWHVCPRYTQNFDINQLIENDLVFLNIDYFEQFINFISNNKPSYKFILVTQNSDRNFTEEMFNLIEPFINKVYAINATFINTKLIKTPLGFNDTSLNHIINVENNIPVKEKLIYCNFKICHHSERTECFDYFKDFKWVDFELNTLNNQVQLSYEGYYEILKTYKYCISPRGAGIDTHRNYEALYFGVIPIVKRCELTDLYEKMPILLVDNWSEITEEFLESNYQHLKAKLDNWLQENKEWNKSKFWINE